MRAALAAALAGGAAAGCANIEQARSLDQLPVQATSPAAQAVLEAARKPGRYPTFQEIPPVPSDVRPADAWRQAVADVKAEGAQLQAQIAADPPTLSDSEGWAARQVQAATPPPSPEQTDTEAFVREARDRAKPPPKPQ